MAKKFVVRVTFADLRKEPCDLASKDFSHHPLRDSQLLFGEKLFLLDEKNDWLKVASLDQPHFLKDKGWHPYEGWVKREEVKEVLAFQKPNFVVCKPKTTIHPQNLKLLYGTGIFIEDDKIVLPWGETASCDMTTLRPIPVMLSRSILLQDAKQFLHAPYLWGGRAMYSEKGIASVDCSGILSLLFLAQGVCIPRDAYPQFLVSKPVAEPEAGDCIYLTKNLHITHVVLKVDESTYLEAPESGKNVRLLKWGQDLWKEQEKLVFKDRPDPYFAFARSFF